MNSKNDYTHSNKHTYRIYKKLYATAIGNAHANARGDILGKNGKVVKKREDIVHEYNTKVKNAVKNIPISQDITRVNKSAIKEETAEQKKNKKPQKPE